MLGGAAGEGDPGCFPRDDISVVSEGWVSRNKV